MITFLVTQRHISVPRSFFKTWGEQLTPELMPRVRLLAYEQLQPEDLDAGGTYIFTDLERFFGWEQKFASRIERLLDVHPARPLILNRPSRYVGRFELLQRWHNAGINDYQAFRTKNLPDELNFPVFLKRDYDHRTDNMQAFGSHEELATARKGLSLQDRVTPHRLMVVEKCDVTGEDGLNRKYSACKIGPHLVPRHVLFSQNWVTKKPDLVTAETVKEENEFIEEFPHRESVGRAFEVANLDYGRIDYGVKNGRIQVWEINTNPTIVPKPKNVDPLRIPSQTESARQLLEAFASLDDNEQTNSAPPVGKLERARWKTAQNRSHLLWKISKLRGE